jgi:hypothetical protein
MTITIYPSRIEYSDANGSFSLIESARGFYTRAGIFAKNIQNGTRGQVRSFFVSSTGAFLQTFPHSTDSNSSVVGNQLVARSWATGQSSLTHGYSTNGANPSTNVIERFPFVGYGGSMVDVGDTTKGRVFTTGHSSATHGYTAGGSPAIDPTAPQGGLEIEKFPFAAATTNAVNLGSLLPASPQRLHEGISTEFDAYIPSFFQKFSFASETTRSQFFSPSPSIPFAGGVTGETAGYSVGGQTVTTINKFPFASTTPIAVTNPFSLPSPGADMACSQGQTFGYILAGRFADKNTLLKFPFANDSAGITQFGTSANTTGITFGGTHY